MREEDLEEYECQAAGHSSGSRSFYEPPGRSPKWCPDECRPWRIAQANQAYLCQGCGVRFCVTAQTKIYHYYNVGPWEDPTLCPRCERGEIPPSSTDDLLELDDVEEEELSFDKLPINRDAVSRPLNIDPADYQRFNPNEGLTRQQHIERHTTWSQFSRTSEPDLRDRKSPTALSSQDRTFEGLLRATNNVTQATHPERVREYLDRDNQNAVVRVTLVDDQRIEASILRLADGPNGHELITTFDGLTPEKVIDDYITDGKWY